MKTLHLNRKIIPNSCGNYSACNWDYCECNLVCPTPKTKTNQATKQNRN